MFYNGSFVHINYLSRHLRGKHTYITLRGLHGNIVKWFRKQLDTKKSVKMWALHQMLFLPVSQAGVFFFFWFGSPRTGWVEHLWRCNHLLSVNNYIAKVLKQENQYLIAQEDSRRLMVRLLLWTYSADIRWDKQGSALDSTSCINEGYMTMNLVSCRLNGSMWENVPPVIYLLKTNRPLTTKVTANCLILSLWLAS